MEEDSSAGAVVDVDTGGSAEREKRGIVILFVGGREIWDGSCWVEGVKG